MLFRSLRLLLLQYAPRRPQRDPRSRRTPDARDAQPAGTADHAPKVRTVCHQYLIRLPASDDRVGPILQGSSSASFRPRPETPSSALALSCPGFSRERCMSPSRHSPAKLSLYVLAPTSRSTRSRSLSRTKKGSHRTSSAWSSQGNSLKMWGLSRVSKTAGTISVLLTPSSDYDITKNACLHLILRLR